MTTVSPQPSAEALRRAQIKQRRKQSTFWTAVHLLGSLNLAVTLLITIAGAIAFATVMESKFDSKVAAYYIYNAAWFNFWLLALTLNLICSALSRWPWQRKHIGFVITHAGIITLLAGAMIGKAFGFEAFVTLDKTKPPESRLFMRDNILTLDTSDGNRWQWPFDTDMHPPSEKKPLSLPLQHSPLVLVVDRYSESLVPDDSLVASTDTAAPAAVGLHFINEGMGQNVPANLLLDGESAIFNFFGFARILLVPSLDEAHPILPAPEKVPPATPAGPSTHRDATPFHETELVFAHSPETPVVDTDSDAVSGFVVHLAPVVGKAAEFEVTVTSPQGDSRTWPLAALQKSWLGMAGEGDPLVFHVAKFWPDFAMRNGVPISVTDQPRNPTALVQVTGPSQLLPPTMPKPGGAPAAVAMPKGLVMRVALSATPGKLVYELEREGKIEARQTAAPGDLIHLGWSKWQAKVDAIFPHAELHREVKETTGTGAVSPQMVASTRPGIRAHLVGLGQAAGPVEWIPGGSSRELFCGNDFVRVGFGQRTIPLSFQITLENFEVPRDEGTDTPSNFISTLRFDEPSTGRVVHDRAFMNSPAMFPGDFWRSVLGWNYKFSQANWDPANLNETTLQVLYDPGWPLKWIGSLGICSGIALMFYFMPRRTASQRREQQEA